MFNETPRFVGFPNQLWVETKFAFDNFERMFKNKVPYFVSPFRYKRKGVPIVDNLLFDIDSYFSIRMPWRNVKKLSDWCYKRDIPVIQNFSGGKGFHAFILFKPVPLYTPRDKVDVSNLMYSIQMRLSKELGLEAFDSPTYGRIRFLIRYPTSKYIRANEETGKLEENGMYCRYLTNDEFDKGCKHISKLVKEPGIVPQPLKSDISLLQISHHFKNFKIIPRKADNQIKLKIKRLGNTVPNVPALGLPCLQAIATNTHPTHFERVELVAWLKHLQYTDIAINAFIKNRNWTRYRPGITSYQIRSVKPRPVKCSFLEKSYGHLCKNCSFKRRHW